MGKIKELFNEGVDIVKNKKDVMKVLDMLLVSSSSVERVFKILQKIDKDNNLKGEFSERDFKLALQKAKLFPSSKSKIFDMELKIRKSIKKAL